MLLLLLLHPLLPAIVVLNLNIKAADASNDFFRSLKSGKLVPSGGSLVSGRGNFRPGFGSRLSDSPFYFTEP